MQSIIYAIRINKKLIAFQKEQWMGGTEGSSNSAFYCNFGSFINLPYLSSKRRN